MAVSEYIKNIRAKIGHESLIIPSITALIFDDQNRVLLHRSTDDGNWHTIGGAIEPEESPADAVVREVREETGLYVIPEFVSGVYTRSPITYANGDVCIYVTIAFRCAIRGGQLGIGDDESYELRYFGEDELPDLNPPAALEVRHGFENEPTAWFKKPTQTG